MTKIWHIVNMIQAFLNMLGFKAVLISFLFLFFLPENIGVIASTVTQHFASGKRCFRLTGFCACVVNETQIRTQALFFCVCEWSSLVHPVLLVCKMWQWGSKTLKILSLLCIHEPIFRPAMLHLIAWQPCSNQGKDRNTGWVGAQLHGAV